ncbi:MAG: glycosyltransferase family 4 protein [Candidatus Diapherotrites archaeon]
MKILHLMHHFRPCIGGMERSLEESCIEIVKAGHECRVVCLDRCAHASEKLPACEEFRGIDIIRIPFLDFGPYKIAFGALKHARDADVIHVHGLGFFSDLALLSKFIHNKPVVIGSYGGIFHTGSNPIKWLYFYFWNRLLLRLADKVVVISGHDFGLFKKIVPDKKLALIPVPVETDSFSPGKKEKGSFAFVGRLSKNKRVDLLIEAFAKAFKGKKAKLYIAGNDFEGLLPGLKAQAEKEGISKQVFFLGVVNDSELHSLLSKSEFFVSASDYESFGISTIEAMASGCVPVLSRIPSFESFLENEKNGFLLDFHETGKVASKLQDISGMPEKQLAGKRKNAIAFSKRFSPRRIAGELISLYSNL